MSLPRVNTGSSSDDCCVTEGNPDAGQQLAHIERLRHVIVRARVQRRNLVIFMLAYREHDYGDLRPLAEAPYDLNSIQIRQPQVKDNHIGMKELRLAQSVVTRRGLPDVVTLAGQRRFQHAADLQFVINDKYANIFRRHSFLLLQPPFQRVFPYRHGKGESVALPEGRVHPYHPAVGFDDRPLIACTIVRVFVSIVR